MIIDTSVLVAVHEGEPDGHEFLQVMRYEPNLKMSAGTLVETALVLDSRAPNRLSKRFDRLVSELVIQVDPVDVEQAVVAREAYRHYGRGSGHPAQLNFGDCFAYALASVTGEPLLFKGADFSETDVRRVM